MPKLPKAYTEFAKAYPKHAKAYEALSGICREAGPLSERDRALVKLGIAIGARHEGAVHSHTRKAVDLGLTPGEIRHAALLALTLVGFPNMMAALTWMDDLLPSKPRPKKSAAKKPK